jgi:SAM-dependent methyltransferase
MKKGAEELKSQWLAEEGVAFQGWDWSRLEGRQLTEALPWDYGEIARSALRPETRLLDMGTGGGEFLLSPGHPPKNCSVTEGYAPNLRLCEERLAPLGVTVRGIGESDRIPYGDAEFDLVLNRHESFDAEEVFRVLKPDGSFITQQVGCWNNRALIEALLPGQKTLFPGHDLEGARKKLECAGFIIERAEESFPLARFMDIGAVVYYAKIIEWE